MKNYHFFFTVLCSAIFLSCHSPRLAHASNSRALIMTSMETEERALKIADYMQEIAVSIVEVAPENQTFENTFKPWIELSSRVHQDLKMIRNAISSEQDILVIKDLHAYWLSIKQNPEILKVLTEYSLKNSSNEELNPFQAFLITSFLQKTLNVPFYVEGESEQKATSETDFSVLNLTISFLRESQTDDLFQEILMESPDLLCFHEIFTDAEAYLLYENLKQKYAFFVFIPPEDSSEDIFEMNQKGMLIASKFNIHEMKYNIQPDKEMKTCERLFDFILKNGDISLGHIYSASMNENYKDKSELDKLMEIAQIIRPDILNSENESIPFIFCGNLMNSQFSEGSDLIIDPSLVHSERVGFSDFSHDKSCSIFKKSKIFRQSQFIFTPHLTRRGGNDNGGAGGSGEIEITATFGGGKDTEIKVSANGEVHDGHGNYVSGSGGYNITSGEGYTSIRGGTISEKD